MADVYGTQQQRCFSGIFLLLGCGMHVAWTFTTFQDITKEIPSTNSEWYLCGVIYYIFIIPGAIMSGYAMPIIGNRRTIAFGIPMMTMAGISFIVAPDKLYGILLGRSLGGLCFGLVYSTILHYFGETTLPDLRGKMLSVIQMMIYSGCAIQFYPNQNGVYDIYMGNMIHGIICVVLSLIEGLAWYFGCESPYYDIIQGHEDGAKKTLMKLHHEETITYEINREFHEIVNMITEDFAVSRTPFKELFLNARNLKAFYEMLLLKLLYIVTFNPLLIFVNIYISFKVIENRYIAILTFASVRIIANVLVVLGVDHWGRKPYLIVSGIGCGVCLALEGGIIYTNFTDHADWTWIPFAFVLLFEFFAGLGYGILPEVLISEAFALNVKHLAITFITILEALIVAGLFTIIVFTSDVGFWIISCVLTISAALCISGAYLIKFTLPETSCRSLRDARDLFK